MTTTTSAIQMKHQRLKRVFLVLVLTSVFVVITVSVAIHVACKTLHDTMRRTTSMENFKAEKARVQFLERKAQPVTMQQCVLDLIVTLRQSQQNNTLSLVNNTGCKGFLIRDDAVLTNQKCAEFATSANVGGYNGTREIESKVESGLLALIKLKLPRYNRDMGPDYHENSGWPRLRMFLTNDGTLSKAIGDWTYAHDTNDGILLLAKCENSERRPTLSVFKRDDRGRLATMPLHFAQNHTIDVSFTEMIPDKAAHVEMRNDKGERWWAKKENETAILHKIVSDWIPRHSSSDGTELSVADGCGMGGVLEMEDPMGGRNYACLKNYFRYWADEEPFSGEPFFEWLDYGSGRCVELSSCSREKLNEKRLHFYNETELNNSRVQWLVGDNRSVRLKYANSGMPVANGTWLFVWGLDRELYVLQEERHVDGHVSFFGGRPVLFAGEFAVCGDFGDLVALSSKSGHYRPRQYHTKTFFQHLKGKGILPQGMKWERNKAKTLDSWNHVRLSFQSHTNQTSLSCPQLGRPPRKKKKKRKKRAKPKRHNISA